MVNEREPPRMQYPEAYGATQQHSQTSQTIQSHSQPPLQDRPSQPQFGTASPLRNPLTRTRDGANIFNVPKANKPRPEHHKPLPAFKMPKSYSPFSSVGATPVGDHPASEINEPLPTFTVPRNYSPSNAMGLPHTESRQSSESPSVLEIPEPTNFGYRPIHAAPKVFSSKGSFHPVNAWKQPVPISSLGNKSNFFDLTATDDGFDPDQAFQDVKFGEFDPLSYIDATQANENIKALLEGAMDEDEDDKPKTRLRKKKTAPAPTSLADKLKALEVKESAPQETEDEDDGTVDGLSVKLLPHQIDGLAWMLDKEIGNRKKNGVLPKGGILADDMGLGKTIQALSLILSNPRPGPQEIEENKKRKLTEKVTKCTLVVAPLALIKQWESEIKTKVEKSYQLKVLVHHGASRTKKFEDLKKFDVVITTYQTLSSEHAASSNVEGGLQVGCFGIHWYRVILDEAHSIKNRNAKMSKAACTLNAAYRWCLTGTPMQNNLDELQSLIHFLRIQPYSELNVWRSQISGPMKNGKGGLAIKRIQYFLKAFMKRRTKEILKKDGALTFGKQTNADGPAEKDGFKIVERRVETIVCNFSPKERVFYNELAARTEQRLNILMRCEKNDYIGALVLLLRLRQTCNHPDLIRGNLRKEKDAISMSSSSQTPSKPKSTESGEIDDIADMFGGLTVKTKECNGCRTALSEFEARSGAIMCSSCESGLRLIHSSETGTSQVGSPQPVLKDSKRRPRVDRRVLDSDDEREEGEGDRVVPQSQHTLPHLGTAGDTDDENAEGGGDWLGDEDSDTGDEDMSATRLPSRSRVPDDDSDEDESDEELAESDDEHFPTTPLQPPQTKKISSTKIRRLIKLLHKESKQHKFIVFSEFTSMLDIVEPFLAAEGFKFTRYDGSMRNDEREASLERLRTDRRTRILLCSLKCGSLGLNLTAASRVVLLEPFWNPFVEEQAIDRVHRLNQTVDVVVYRLTMSNSVEERILALQEKKRELAKAAIEGGKAVNKLSMKDILNLFKGDAEHDAALADGSGPVNPRSERLLVPSPVKQPAPLSRPKPQGLPGAYSGQYGQAYARRWS